MNHLNRLNMSDVKSFGAGIFKVGIPGGALYK